MSAAASAPAAPAGRVALEKLLSVAIFAFVLFQMYMSTKVGVTPRGTPAREALQHTHIAVGLTVLLLLIPRLWLWATLPRPPRPARVPAAADALARHCNLAFYLTLLGFCITGPIFAWSEGHDVSWFGLVTLPDLVAKSYRLSVTLGYLHSVIGFWILYLTGFTLLVALWQAVRYRAPPWRLLPAFGWGR
jgi:cytochrome b561